MNWLWLILIPFAVVAQTPRAPFPPNAPSNTFRITLCWDKSVSQDVTSYRVYWGPASRSYTNFFEVVTNCCAFSTNIGLPKYFAVTARNSAGLESDYSNELRYPELPRTNVVIIAQKSTDLVEWIDDRRWTNSISDTNALWRLKIE